MIPVGRWSDRQKGVNMEIRLVLKKRGRIYLNRKARQTATVEDILEIAEKEVNDGYADYAMVEVDGEIYAEYEA